MTPSPPAPPPPENAPTETPPPARIRVRLPLQPVRVTYALLGLVGLTFAAQLGSEFFLGYDVVLGLGAKENTLIARGEIWRLLTAIFIHGSVLHVLFNAYALYNLGQEVESFYGSLRFGLLFFFAGLSGSAASLLLNPHPAVGVSGAVFGLIGAEGIFLFRNRRLLGPRAQRALQNVILITILNLAIGLQGGIDNWAHLGGLIGGLALGWLIGPVWGLRFEAAAAGEVPIAERNPLAGARWWAAAAAAGALAALTGFAIALRR